MTPIYLIARSRHYEGYDGRDYTMDEVDHDLGYFLDRRAALELVERIDTPRKEDFVRKSLAYDEAVAKERAKAEEARKLGFRHSMNYPMRPEKPELHSVVEVLPYNGFER